MDLKVIFKVEKDVREVETCFKCAVKAALEGKEVLNYVPNFGSFKGSYAS